MFKSDKESGNSDISTRVVRQNNMTLKYLFSFEHV